jgi:hypothetical protein
VRSGAPNSCVDAQPYNIEAPTPRTQRRLGPVAIEPRSEIENPEARQTALSALKTASLPHQPFDLLIVRFFNAPKIVAARKSTIQPSPLVCLQ